MQDAASVLTDQFVELLARFPADLDLDRLVLETKAIQRRHEVVDGAALLRIALARGPGGLSLRQTAAWASMLGTAELSNPGVKYRLNQATDFLAALGRNLYGAFGVKRISSCASLILLRLNRARSRAVARSP